MRGQKSWSVPFVLVSFLGLGAGVACKEGGDLADASVAVSADFLEETVPARVMDHLVQLEKGSVQGELITLNVVVTEVSEPVSGIALKLSYPSQFAKFSKCMDGDLLPSPPGACISAEPAPGEVFIGRSIQAPQSPTPVAGSQVIVRIQFLLTQKGSGNIIIEAQNLSGGDASALLDANGDPIRVQWYSGVLSGK
jgi:hypothetical protein